MISWNSLILCWNNSRVGKAISDNSLIGVPSCFSGGRRMVKWTRAMEASDFSKLRQVRSPECASPETSSTRSLSRTPSMEITARLLTRVSSLSSGEASISTMFGPACLMSMSPLTVCALSGAALVVEPVGDGLGLADNAESRRGGNRDAAVALVLLSCDQRMYRGGEAQCGRIVGDIVDPAVGDQEGAGDAVGGNVRKRRRQRAEKLGAVGFAVGLAGLDHAHFKALDLLQAVDQFLLRLCGLFGAIAKALARTLVDHHGSDRGQRLAVFAGKRWIGQRQQNQRQRRDPDRRTAGTADQQQRRDHDDRGQA